MIVAYALAALTVAGAVIALFFLLLWDEHAGRVRALPATRRAVRPEAARSAGVLLAARPQLD